MKRTLEVLNKLVESKVIDDYAIGGAMGAVFYAETVMTMDLDVFVLFPDNDDLAPLAPLYARLEEWGYFPDANASECVSIEGIPVQFLPAFDELLQDALTHARTFDYEGVPAKVMRPEHLAAICVQTGRAKDWLRVQTLLESDGFDAGEFKRLLEQYRLSERIGRWQQP